VSDNGRNNTGARTPFDISKVRFYRCDKMGHYVRDCPELPSRKAAVEKEEPVLN
jgi:hypothetical protein